MDKAASSTYAGEGYPSLEWKLAQPCRAGKDPLTFTARLWALQAGKGWTFATIPAATSTALGGAPRIDVVMTVGGKSFPNTCLEIGEGRHILQVSGAVRDAAGKAGPGDEVTFAVALAKKKAVAVKAKAKTGKPAKKTVAAGNRR
jgi:hypothetical protein